MTGGNSKVLWLGVRRIRNVPGSKRDTVFAAEDSSHSWKPLLKHSGTQRSPTMILGDMANFSALEVAVRLGSVNWWTDQECASLGARHRPCCRESRLSLQPAVFDSIPEKASFVRYYERLVLILTSPSARNQLYLKLVPRFSTETPQVICTGGGKCSGQEGTSLQRNDLLKVDLYQIATTYQHLRQPVVIQTDCVNTPFCCIAEGSGLNNPDNISLIIPTLVTRQTTGV